MHELSFSWPVAGLYVLLAASWVLYFCAARRRRLRGKMHWSGWRILSFSAALITIAVALYPPLMHQAHQKFTAHMWVHLLLGMLAPLGLVFAAPVTLAMQSLPTRAARLLYKILNLPFMRLVSHPVTAMVLNVGAMYLLYTTPLYVVSLHHGWLSALIHWHFLAAGYLFVWSVAGPDPAPRRPTMKFRLGILFLSVGAHATLAKLMYAYEWPRNSPHTVADIQAGAQLMYYGGDVAELLLIIAFFALWFRQRDRAARRLAST